jgi:hypothetical protein
MQHLRLQRIGLTIRNIEEIIPRHFSRSDILQKNSYPPALVERGAAATQLADMCHIDNGKRRKHLIAPFNRQIFPLIGAWGHERSVKMTQHALYVQLEAKPGKEQEVASFLSSARRW